METIEQKYTEVKSHEEGIHDKLVHLQVLTYNIQRGFRFSKSKNRRKETSQMKGIKNEPTSN